jgi:D-alanine--poly(phosphoribitol) ligase subunit 1
LIQTSQALWGGEADYGCFLETFAEIVRTREHHVAVRDGLKEITYGHLAVWVERIAGLLTEHGVQPGEPVAVTGPRSAAVVAAALAIASAGAAYVPLDAEYPVRRQRQMATDSGARLLLFIGESPCLGTGLTSVPIPMAPDPAARATGIFTARACEPNAPVYIIYTSGSTGLPKGVALPHRCIDNMAAWQCAHSVRTDLRTAQFAPMNFDVWFQEVLGTLCAGSTLSILPESLRKDPFAFVDWLASERIERVFLPYVALQMLAVAAEAEDSLERLCLAEVNTAGEQLVCTPAIRELFRRLPGCRLNNHYGQSESAMVAVHTLTGPSASWPALPPVGRPLPECEVLIAPTGPNDLDVGELLVAGAPMSAGYLHQPTLNAERYVAVEPTPRGHTLAFRTGDLVRVVDGVIHFISRVDHEVKVRGIRVNPLEVDAHLLERPGVVEAVTVPVEIAPGSRQLRAAVTLDRDERPDDVAAIIEALADSLPEQAVPVSVTVLPGLPRTPSGKIDRVAIGDMLMATAQGRPSTRHPHAPDIAP